MTDIRPRRSLLYVPGANARAVGKARTLACDVVILDLEDSVAPEVKADARAEVVRAVAAKAFGPREVVIRINARSTPWHEEDIAGVLAARPDAVLLPKVSSAEDIFDLGERLGRAPADMAIWAMIETPAAIVQAAAIAGAVRERAGCRLEAFVLGLNDLAKETGARLVPGRANMLPWISWVLVAARAEGLVAIDGVHNAIGDPEGLEAECVQARDLGFDGKSLIHPLQIDPANRLFAPTQAEVESARELVALFEQPENRGRGAVALNGRMVERLHAEMAARILSMAEAIARCQS